MGQPEGALLSLHGGRLGPPFPLPPLPGDAGQLEQEKGMPAVSGSEGVGVREGSSVVFKC